MTIFRFRRYRVFVALALVAILLLLRLNKSRNWALPRNTDSDFEPPSQPAKPNEHTDLDYIKKPSPVAVKDEVKDEPAAETPISTSLKAKQTPAPEFTKSTPAPSPAQASAIDLPARKPIPPTRISEDETPDSIHAVGPPSRHKPLHSAEPAEVIHWKPQAEHFPVAPENVIHLPTGVPVAIPKIQHPFNDETPDAKINREKRQKKVLEEFQKAWSGYKTHAWLHDELTPETGSFSDPFCGWAATLVDGLDTLWIMGLHEEFEEAVDAVKMLDFTTTVGERADIPMFETTIRYLGGLIAAYDVSGAQYKILLEKAEELAQILMGAFDTPNRMPELYYHWKPTFASQPKMASRRSSLAELGSLSLEFTRLAQLTSNQRYYDAVARITNALSEWQNRGTPLGGVFPDNVDASGCNRTAKTQMPITPAGEPAVAPIQNLEPPVGFQPDLPANVAEPKPNKRPQKDGPGNLELQIVESQPGGFAKGRIQGWDDSGEKNVKRDENALDNTLDTKKVGSVIKPVPSVIKSPAKAKLDANLGGGCEPQGLIESDAYGKYSMGGGQDSTYEYFPKQFLLLGGLEPKYESMYKMTIADIKRYMLYRPMIPDNRDILFSGSVTTKGKPEEDVKLSADVEHLTCFIGGMIGMSAKIFGLEGDLEIAQKLTDGCVWAYHSFPIGVMAEAATVLPCESVKDCSWNQTAFYAFIDPMGATRDQNVAEYDRARAEQKIQEAARQAEEEKALATGPSHTAEEIISDVPPANDMGHDYDTTDPSRGSESLKKEKPVSLERRDGNFNDAPKGELTPTQKALEEKLDSTEAELEEIEYSGRQHESPPLESEAPPKNSNGLAQDSKSPAKTHGEAPPDPFRPANHTQYVETQIKNLRLPPGFVTLKARKYILRPEAIESVWYMYRITGDPVWQEKGWRMFEAIIKATSTKYGHSAIYDVTDSAATKMDSMESFWLAETLKYFYLLFSTPDTISLDDWVLNTEAHPFKRPT